MNNNPLAEKRTQFNEILREQKYYPGAKYPGDCYIFDVVLGIDPRKVVAHELQEDRYRLFIVDPMTNRKRTNPDGTPQIVTRRFTPDQKRKLKEWWDLFSDEARGVAQS